MPYLLTHEIGDGKFLAKKCLTSYSSI